MIPHDPARWCKLIACKNLRAGLASSGPGFLVRASGTMGDPPVMDSAEGGAVGFPQ
jgi:hypothetical protein